MSTHPLIVFDSGLGGLSILKELLSVDTPLIYYADNANFPYGDKSSLWLQNRLLELSSIFKKYDPCGVVIACNTGTVSGISLVRQSLNCPVFGVEPVVKMLAHHKNPVVWGTKVTLSSDSAKTLLQSHGNMVRFYTPTNLATAIENLDADSVTKILTEAKDELGEVDAIGLSCTHYPLIKPQISNIFPGVSIYDPSAAVATHVIKSLNLMINKSLILNRDIEFVASGDVLRLKRIAKRYLYEHTSILS